MIVLTLILALLIALVTLIFAVANGTPVTVNLLFTQISTPLSLAILAPFFAGVIVGLLVMLPGSIKRSLTIASHKRRIDMLEKSLPPDEKPGAAQEPSDSQSG